MGCHENIAKDKFPKQSELLHKRVNVVFHYHTEDEPIEGVILRDDLESPGITIIGLYDGRYILDTECQYHLT